MIIEPHLQDTDGFELIQQAQEISPDTEIIILTGEGTMESAIQAIQLGAHDYLLKSDSEQEILSSVASAIARQNQRKRKRILLEQMEKTLWALKDLYGMGEVVKPKKQIITFPDGVKLDLPRQLIWKHDEEIHLNTTDTKLLGILLDHHGQVISYTDFAFLIYGEKMDAHVAASKMRTIIYRLRLKLKSFEESQEWIKTIPGSGYVFVAELP